MALVASRLRLPCAWTVAAMMAAMGAMLAAGAPAMAGPPAQPLAVLRTFSIGGDGGWDYITIESKQQLLFVTRTTHTQVISAADGKVVADIPANHGSHGVALAPAAGRGFISNGRSGTVTVFDLKTYRTLGEIPAADDADGIIFDPFSNRVLVACGDAGVLVPIDPSVDLSHPKSLPAIQLGGKPEFLAADGRGKVFVNLQDKSEVTEVDLAAGKVTATWPLSPGQAPTGLALDSVDGRLFSGCRGNSRLIALDTASGRRIADLPIGQGVDATAAYNGLALASCGDGTLTVAGDDSAGNLKVAQVLRTLPGARTMAVDRDRGLIYLPTADLAAAPAPTADHPHPRPRPIPGTFKIVVVGTIQP